MSENSHDEQEVVVKKETVSKIQEHQSAGVTVLQWLSYAFWGWLIVGMIWMLSLVLMSFIVEEPSSTASEMLPYSIAAIVVLLPVAFVVDLFYRRYEPVKKVGAAAVVMIIHAVIFALLGIGVLIAAIFTSLSAVIDGGASSGRTVAIWTLFSATVLYGAALLRTLRLRSFDKLPFVYSLFMLGLSVVLLVFGFIGPMARSIATRDDRRIESSLSSVSGAINRYVDKNDRLPGGLSDIDMRNNTEAKSIVDDGLVEYVSEGTAKDSVDGRSWYRYQLCVEYAERGSFSGDYFYDDEGSEYRTYLSTGDHDSGKVCYKMQIPVRDKAAIEDRSTDKTSVDIELGA